LLNLATTAIYNALPVDENGEMDVSESRMKV